MTVATCAFPPNNLPGVPQKPPALLGKQEMDAMYIPDDCDQLPIAGAPQPQDYTDLRFIRGVVIGIALALGCWSGIATLAILIARAVG